VKGVARPSVPAGLPFTNILSIILSMIRIVGML